jgi:hypothetical protein
MAFEVQGDEPLAAIVKLRLTPREKQRIRDDAELAGLTMSEFMRRRAFGRAILPAADLAMIRELRRLGGLLKHVHVASGGAYSNDTAAAIAQIRAFIDQLSAEQVQPGNAP